MLHKMDREHLLKFYLKVFYLHIYDVVDVYTVKNIILDHA